MGYCAMSNHFKRVNTANLLATALLLTSFSAISGEACTYDEGVLAFKQNNMIRAKMLLDMATRDGDIRAEQFLVKHFKLKEQPVRVAMK